MKGYEESAIFMGAGMAKIYGMMPHNDYREGMGHKARKAKKAKRRAKKQGRRNTR